MYFVLMKIETKFKLTALCVFVVMLFVAALPYVTGVTTRDKMKESRGALAREQQFQSLLDLLRDAETGQRGFVITGKENFLAPYYQALSRLPPIRQTLNQPGQTPAVQKAVEQIFSTADLKLVELAATISLRRTDGFATVEKVVSSERGKQYMDSLRDLIGRQIEDSLKQRNKLRDDLELATDRVLYAGVAATLINLSILALLLIMMLRLLAERKSATYELQGTSDKLRLANVNAALLNEQLEISAGMMQALGAAATIQETYQIIATYCGKLFPELSGALYLHRNSRDALLRQAFWGAPVAVTEHFEPHECWALKRGRIHHTQDAQDLCCAHYTGSAKTPTGRLCLPLVSHSEVIGLLYVESHSGRDATIEQKNLLDRAAEQMSLALTNVKLRETLHRQSIIDPLTGMFNRRYMDETLKRELSRAERKKAPLSLIVLDLDHFKAVNDIHGHNAGDHVLKSVAKKITDNIRDGDLACRFGGEELVLILPECDVTVAMQRAEKIRAAIDSLDLRHGGVTLGKVTASLGVAGFPQHGRDATALIHTADQAMYCAKETGRNRVVLGQ